MGGPRRECPTLLGPKAMLVQGDPKYPCLELTLTSTAVSGQFNERNMVNVGVVETKPRPTPCSKSQQVEVVIS
jgi:hypothetical protein